MKDTPDAVETAEVAAFITVPTAWAGGIPTSLMGAATANPNTAHQHAAHPNFRQNAQGLFMAHLVIRRARYTIFSGARQ